jgi:hypothetical protein
LSMSGEWPGLGDLEFDSLVGSGQKRHESYKAGGPANNLPFPNHSRQSS